MLDNELEKNDLELKCAANTPELTFPFDPPLPVGFAYPIEDEEWGRELALAMSEMITGEKRTEEAWEKVKQDLKEVEIEAFTFPELCLSLMRSMKYDEACEWYNKLPKKLQSEISKQ